MKLQEFLVGFVIIGLVFGIIGYMLSTANNVYPINELSTDEFNELQVQVNKTSMLTQELQNKITNISQEQGDLDKLGTYFGGAYDSMQIAGSSVDTFTTMSTIITKKTTSFIPPFIWVTLVGIVAIAFVSMLVYYIFKVK